MSKMSKQEVLSQMNQENTKQIEYLIQPLRQRPTAKMWIRPLIKWNREAKRIIIQNQFQRVKDQIAQMKKPIQRKCGSPYIGQQVKKLNICKQEDYHQVGNLTFIRSRGVFTGDVLHLHRKGKNDRGDTVHIGNYCYDQGTVGFYKNILPLSKNLTEAWMNFGDGTNDCTDLSMSAFSKRLSKCNKLNKFRLDLNSQRDIQDNDLFVLSQGLKYCTKLEDFQIDIDRSNTTDQAMKNLASGLVFLKKLKKLEVRHTSPYQTTTGESVRFLSQAVEGMLDLEELTFFVGWNCYQFGDEVYEYFFPMIPKFTKLKKLKVSLISHYRKTTAKYINLIRESLYYCTNLEVFEFCAPQETTISLEDRNLDLSLGIGQCKKLETLSLDLERFTFIKESEAITLKNSLIQLTGLKSLTLTFKNVNRGGFPTLIDGIISCKELHELYLQFSISQIHVNGYNIQDYNYIGQSGLIIETEEEFRVTPNMIQDMQRIFKECRKISVFQLDIWTQDKVVVNKELWSNLADLLQLCPDLEKLILCFCLKDVEGNDEAISQIAKNIEKMDKLKDFEMLLGIYDFSAQASYDLDRAIEKISKQTNKVPRRSDNDHGVNLYLREQSKGDQEEQRTLYYYQEYDIEMPPEVKAYERFSKKSKLPKFFEAQNDNDII